MCRMRIARPVTVTVAMVALALAAGCGTSRAETTLLVKP
jgi:hypothetical protein